jgi:hypothetical protein
MTDGVVDVVAAAAVVVVDVVDVVVVFQGSPVAVEEEEEKESPTGLWELVWVPLVLMMMMQMVMGAGVELVETQIGGVVEVEVDFRHRRHLESTLIEPEVEVVIVMEMHYQWVHSGEVVDFGSARYPIRHSSFVGSFGGHGVVQVDHVPSFHPVDSVLAQRSLRTGN